MPKKLTTEEFIEKAKLVHGDKYDYSLADYKSSITKVKIICKKHGIFEQVAKNHLCNIGCGLCNGGSALSNESFLSKATEKHGEKYNYDLVEYKKSNIKIMILCPEHGIFEQKPSAHIFGKGCSECAGNKKLNTDIFIEKSKKVHGDRYGYSNVKYVNHKTKVLINCDLHGEFSQIANLHLMGCGCPCCKRSKGEIKIYNFLKQNNINFIEEFTFKDCKKIYSLPFDFYLTDINILIEYDGEQHFRPVKHFGGTEEFIKRKENENIKNLYTQKNKIPLLRISYLFYELVDEIIYNFIKNCGISKNDNLNLEDIEGIN